MKNFIQNEWIKGILISLVASLIFFIGQNYITIPYLTKILSISIPIWAILIILVISVFILSTFMKKKRFLKETETEINGWTWTWSWEYNKDTKRYKIVDFNLRCKCGGIIVRALSSEIYSCSQCNKKWSINNPIIPSPPTMKRNIIADIKRKYPNEASRLEKY